MIRSIRTAHRYPLAAFTLLSLFLSCLLPGARAGAAPNDGAHEWPVADFENGLVGWSTNDTDRAAGKAPDTKLVHITVAGDAHAGRGCLEIRFLPGQGWANAYVDLADPGPRWAANRVDEVRFWMKGDGSDKQVKVDLQAWADDLKEPLFFQVPLSLKEMAWHRVAIPLARFEAALPGRRLRTPSLISFQFDAADGIGPAALWIDDVTVASAHGQGARFGEGPLDAQVALRPPAGELPRLGNWMYPGRDIQTLDACLRLGMGFSSNWDIPVVQQRVFLGGLVTNLSPGRPSGAELISGLGLTDADMDQDAEGRRTGEGIESSVFHPQVAQRFYDYVARRVRDRANAPWVASVALSSPISMYGEVHFAASTGNQYAVFSQPARANFRRWLRAQYRGDLAALSRAWGRPIGTWEEIAPPKGPQAPAGGIDTRTEWSDFMHWYNGWLYEVTWKSLQAARRETTKPIAAMIGGPKIGLSQGIALGNVGPVVRMLGRLRPAFFSDTDSQTLYSCRYTRAACSQYGVKLMLEHVGPPGLEVFHQYNMLLNVLACGGDYAHLAHWGELFDEKHWFSRVWKGLAPVLLAHRTGYLKSDACLLHSYVTSWYRPDRSNGDGVALYDSTNTLWYPDRRYPSWGRVLGSPDVVDDTMVEDGALAGRKLLVIPNTSVTVTTRKGVEAIRRWVRAGGTLVGFGPGCLAYTLEADRSLRATPGLAGMLPDLPTNGDSGGQAAVERRLGKGRVVLYPYPADPNRLAPSGRSWAWEAMPALEAQARRAGVRRWCRTDAGTDVNVMYAGRDTPSGRHLFAADLTRYVRNGLPDAIFWTDRTIRLSFDPSLQGEAELIGVTDAFEACEGGEAHYDAKAHTLSIRFRLPGTLSLRFGRSHSGLALARHPLLLWQDGDLVLRGTEGYGTVQTQAPITVGGDGTLEPSDAKMLYLVHGDLHRPKFGRGPTFRMSLARPGALVIHVNSVTRQGAVLVVRLDGHETLRRALPDRDDRGDPFNNEYNEDVVVPAPVGEHTVQVDNEGGDWMTVDRYVFRGLAGR